MHKHDKDCRCTTDAPCPSRKEPLTMVGPAYRSVAHPEHVEFSPTHEVAPTNKDGWSRIDGLKKLDNTELFVVSKLYRKHLGVVNGEDVYFVGEYVGNRRVKMSNEDNPLVVGTTWQIYLQEDKELNTPMECYRLCDLEVVDGAGTKIVTANDYTPERPEVLLYYDKEAPPKPEFGAKVDHPVHGGGEIVRVTGTGSAWYASVEFEWETVNVPPSEGVSVRRMVQGEGDQSYYVYGEICEVEGHRVTVEYENGKEHESMVRDFYRTYSRIVEMGSHNFYEVLGLDRPSHKMTVNARRLSRDPRTSNERAFAAPSRSTVAFSALIAANTPDSGHFVPRRGSGGFREGSGFRWHRERPLAPKNRDFAPLVGRPEKVPRPKKGRTYDRLNAAREKLALAPAPVREDEESARRGGSIWERPDPPAPSEKPEISDAEFADYHGTTVMF